MDNPSSKVREAVAMGAAAFDWLFGRILVDADLAERVPTATPPENSDERSEP